VRKRVISVFVYDQQVQYLFWSTARNLWMSIMQLHKILLRVTRLFE
jgi:hypothetical protein